MKVQRKSRSVANKALAAPPVVAVMLSPDPQEIDMHLTSDPLAVDPLLVGAEVMKKEIKSDRILDATDIQMEDEEIDETSSMIDAKPVTVLVPSAVSLEEELTPQCFQENDPLENIPNLPLPKSVLQKKESEATIKDEEIGETSSMIIAKPVTVLVPSAVSLEEEFTPLCLKEKDPMENIPNLPLRKSVLQKKESQTTIKDEEIGETSSIIIAKPVTVLVPSAVSLEEELTLQCLQEKDPLKNTPNLPHLKSVLQILESLTTFKDEDIDETSSMIDAKPVTMLIPSAVSLEEELTPQCFQVSRDETSTHKSSNEFSSMLRNVEHTEESPLRESVNDLIEREGSDMEGARPGRVTRKSAAVARTMIRQCVQKSKRDSSRESCSDQDYQSSDNESSDNSSDNVVSTKDDHNQQKRDWTRGIQQEIAPWCSCGFHSPSVLENNRTQTNQHLLVSVKSIHYGHTSTMSDLIDTQPREHKGMRKFIDITTDKCVDNRTCELKKHLQQSTEQESTSDIKANKNGPTQSKRKLKDSVDRCPKDGRKLINCPICGIKIKQNVLKKHSLKHSDNRAFKCELCPKAFKRKACLQSHMRHMHDNTFIKCNYCEKQYKGKSHLRRHEKIHEGIDPPKAKCDICGKVLEKTGMRRHILTHSTEYTFSCNICDKKFSSKVGLNYHISRIHKSRPGVKHICEICGLILKSPSSLSDHINKHSGTTPYTCHVCGKSFSVKKSLNQHMDTHGEKKYKCDECGYATNRFYNLITHIRSHTGEKPFECMICSQTFTRLDNLQTHKTQVHKIA